jgi:hypothetical protein
MDAPIWSGFYPGLNAAEVAARFAKECVGDRREPASGSLEGGWEGPEFHGSFRLEGGVGRYALSCSAGGKWQVCRLPAA